MLDNTNMRELILKADHMRKREFIAEFQDNYQSRLISLVYDATTLSVDSFAEISTSALKFESDIDVACLSIKTFSPTRQVMCPIDLAVAHLNVHEFYALNNSMEEVEMIITIHRQNALKREIALSKLTPEEISLLGL